MFRALKFLLFSAVSIVFIAFAVSNRDTLTVALFPLQYTVEMPKFLFATLCFAMGIILCGISMHLHTAKGRLNLIRERKRTHALENELKALKMEKETGFLATLRTDA